MNDYKQIIQVYQDNFLTEIKQIGQYLPKYNYIGMDTEFPGIIVQLPRYTQNFDYLSIKANVEKLNLVQLGISLCDAEGNIPDNIAAWQFNFKFDYQVDKYSIESLSLLSNSGIDFDMLRDKGIPYDLFAEYFMTSGLVLNEDVYWVSFHGSYDFAYLLKYLINSGLPLPGTADLFAKELDIYFKHYYDIRVLLRDQDHLQGGLNRLAQYLKVQRLGQTHQAGSDSLLTMSVFNKLLADEIITREGIEDWSNVLYGLGEGEDATYNQFSSNTVYNNPLMAQYSIQQYASTNNINAFPCYYNIYSSMPKMMQMPMSCKVSNIGSNYVYSLGIMNQCKTTVSNDPGSNFQGCGMVAANSF